MRVALHRLEQVFDSLDYHVAIYDGEWRYTYVNAAAARMLGRPAEDLLGRRIWDLFPDLVGSQHYQELHEAAATGRPIHGDRFDPSSGRWYESHVFPQPDGMLVLARDVTMTHHAARALLDSQQQAGRLALMLESTPDFVGMATPDGRITYLNKAARSMLGVPQDADPTRFQHTDLCPAWVVERMRTDWLPAARRDGVVSGEGAVLSLDGHEIPVSFVLLVHHGLDGRIEYVSTIARDISEGRRLEEELRRHADELAMANRLKDDFLATLSHELRTPLNVIRGRVSMLRSTADADAVARATEAIDRNSRMLERLVGDLLDVARMTHGALRLDCAWFEPAPVVQAVLQAMQPAADARQIAIEADIASDLPLLWGDGARLQQVMGNLVSNAVKFTPYGGRVEVRAGVVGAGLEITVRDTGIGIPAEVLPHVFEPFWQAESTATRRFGGLGLGLSIARSIVELHGGQIQVESGGANRGTTFRVWLPVASPGTVAPV